MSNEFNKTRPGSSEPEEIRVRMTHCLLLIAHSSLLTARKEMS
jgi:hypothetical protein